MKNNSTNIIVLLLLGGGVAWYGYDKGWWGKKDDEDKDANDTTGGATIPDAALSKNKVEELQALLGVGVDGIFGGNSYTALCKMYLCITGTSYDVSKLPYGAVSESNASKYIADIQNGLTPYQKANGSTSTPKTTTPSTPKQSTKYIADNIQKAYINSSLYGSSETFVDWVLQPDGTLKKGSIFGTYKTFSSSKPVLAYPNLEYKGWSQGASAFMFRSTSNPKQYTLIEPKYLIVK